MRVNHYWLLLLSLLAVACVKDNTSSTDAPSEESIYYDVSLNFGGEITVEDAPLTRGTPTNDIYGINVYVDNDGDGSITDHYAYGLFDNKEDMTIPLLSGYKYRFECTLIKEAKKTLYYGPAFGNSFSGFGYPFTNTVTTSSIITNDFLLGDNYLNNITNSNAHLADTTPTHSNHAYLSPNINRFHGQLHDYSPTKGGVATIYLERVVFGVKLVINKANSGGNISVTGLWGDLEQTVSATQGYEGNIVIYTLPNIYYDTFSKKIEVKYDSGKGSEWDLSQSADITFKRNTLTTITINVSADNSTAGISTTEEEWNPDNIIDLEVNTNGVIDTPVNPTI